MKIVFITIILAQLLGAETSRSLNSLASYLETHSLAEAGNTQQCFAKYLPQLEQAGSTWSTEYNSCLQNATAVQERILSSVREMKQTMQQSALDVVNYIDNCLLVADVLDFFNCFANLSKQQLTTMYAISLNASESALSLTEQLNGIETRRYLCTNHTEASYVMDTAHIFDQLDECLLQTAEMPKDRN